MNPETLITAILIGFIALAHIAPFAVLLYFLDKVQGMTREEGESLLEWIANVIL